MTPHATPRTRVVLVFQANRLRCWSRRCPPEGGKPSPRRPLGQVMLFLLRDDFVTGREGVRNVRDSRRLADTAVISRVMITGATTAPSTTKNSRCRALTDLRRLMQCGGRHNTPAAEQNIRRHTTKQCRRHLSAPEREPPFFARRNITDKGLGSCSPRLPQCPTRRRDIPEADKPGNF